MKNNNTETDIENIIRDEFKMIEPTVPDKDEKAVQNVLKKLEKKPFYDDLFELLFIIPVKVINKLIGISIESLQKIIHK